VLYGEGSCLGVPVLYNVGNTLGVQVLYDVGEYFGSELTLWHEGTLGLLALYNAGEHCWYFMVLGLLWECIHIYTIAHKLVYMAYCR